MSGLPNFLQQLSEDSSQSENGENGTNGKNGKNGMKGKNGKNGKNVKNGKNGRVSLSNTVLPITTEKCTAAQEITVDERDKAYKVCLLHCLFF